MTHDKPSGMNRRNFVKFCMTALAVSTQRVALGKPQPGTATTYKRSLLINDQQQPIRASDLVAGENYIFHYPYISTPCFLLNLGEPPATDVTLKTEAGERYTSRGGVGPDGSIVAFSAICAHKMTHPAKAVSFINYRHERVRFQNKKKREQEGSQVIFCCSERSVYDARKGAKVLGGPAKQPLASIMLEYDADRDQFYAIGTYGGEMFDKFFTTFTSRLQLEYMTTDVNKLVADRTEVVPLDDYCKTRIFC